MRVRLIGLVGVAVLAAGAMWFFFIRGDAPPPATLEDAVAAVTGETATTEAGAAAQTTGGPVATDGLDGVWVVDQALSFVGYRIDEEVANIGATTAVGRTNVIDATLTFAGTSITAVSVDVDMTTLDSGRSRRDGALETRGLETNTFPTATFVLSEPIDLGSVPVDGETISATAVGDLTLHGATNPVTLSLEGSLVDGTMVVVGMIDVTLTDYDIEAPTGFSILTIADTGSLEVQLAFVRG